MIVDCLSTFLFRYAIAAATRKLFTSFVGLYIVTVAVCARAVHGQTHSMADFWNETLRKGQLIVFEVPVACW